MRKIDKFYTYKEQLDKIYINEYKEMDIGKILYCDVWNMIGLNKSEMILRVIIQILCEPLHISIYKDNDYNSSNMAIEIKFKGQERVDNKNIFDNLYKYLTPAQHYVIEKKYKFNITKIFLKLKKIWKYQKQIKNIDFVEALYLASQLIMVDALLRKLESEINFSKIKYLLIFQEHDTISSSIIQYAHSKGVKVISPQHGMPLNRKEDIEQLIFEGCICDYKLVWNEFSKKQFVSAGIAEEKVYVVGNTKQLGKNNYKLKWEKSNSFGVLFDCPINENAREYNRQLLDIAIAFSKEKQKKVIVKLHPMDDKRNYVEYLKDVHFLDKDISLRTFEEGIEFSIAHITGAVVDLIIDNKCVFIYEKGQNYPIETDKIYRFDSFDSFKRNYEKWNESYEIYKNNYEKIVNLYRVENATELHDLFFERLLNNE